MGFLASQYLAFFFSKMKKNKLRQKLVSSVAYASALSGSNQKRVPEPVMIFICPSQNVKHCRLWLEITYLLVWVASLSLALKGYD